jgi:hypothetical protein
MAKTTKTPKRRSGTFTIGRTGFAKISAVEGVKLSPEAEQDFQEFDDRGLSAAERRRTLAQKYGSKV